MIFQNKIQQKMIKNQTIKFQDQREKLFKKICLSLTLELLQTFYY